MDEVIEKLAAGDVHANYEYDPQSLLLVIMARILMTNMAIAEALSGMQESADDVIGQAGWGGLDG